MTKTYSIRYRPDSFFMKQLKRLDSRLGCKFREDLERFVITWERHWGEPDEIMIVSKPYFRQPDKRELLFLCSGDLHRSDMRERLQKSSAYFHDYQKRQNESVADDIRNMTKDDKRQLASTYRKTYNIGSKQPDFRRIKSKPKGKTLDELQNIGAQ